MADIIRNEGLWLQRYPNEVEALILRMVKKHHALRLVETTSSEEGGRPKTEIGISILRSKKGRDLGIDLAPSEKEQVEKLAPQLAHVLRDDDGFRRELVRVYHRRMNEVYPLGRNCDLTPSFEYVKRADDAAHAGRPFEFMALLLAAVRIGYAIVEEARGRPLVMAPKRESSGSTTSSKQKPEPSIRQRVAADPAEQGLFGR